MSPLLFCACIALFPASLANKFGTQNVQSPQWPDQLADLGWKPRIDYLRQATGVVGKMLLGPKLHWSGAGKPNWTLLEAPEGMMISQSGRILWPEPREGAYHVLVEAEVNGETEDAEWMVTVLRAEFSNSVIYSTRHIDYVVPSDEADWLERVGARGVIDAYYEFGRDLVGGLSIDARQSIVYRPDSAGGAHSGIPIVAGPGPFGDNDVTRWKLGFLWHELAHNFNPMIRCELFDEGNDVIAAAVHGMVEVDKTAWVYRLLKAPDSFGIVDVPHFVEWEKIDSMEFVDGSDRYMQAGPTAPGLLDWKDGPSGVWQGMIHRFSFKYGGDALEKVVRLFRRDGLALADYPDNMTVSDKFTVIMCALSNAVGKDLREDFHAMRMPLNDKFYVKFNAAVANTMAHLPAVAVNGATKCPFDGHFYCLTPHGMRWADAEATARRLGGHLATVRSPDQEQWLANKYGRMGVMWLGARRSQDGAWEWITGESTANPVWEPKRPESDPSKTCMVLVNHEDEPRVEWFGVANRPPTDTLMGILEFDHAPTRDIDDLN